MPYSVRKSRAKSGGWDVYKKHGKSWRKVAHSRTKTNAQSFVRIAEEATGKYSHPKYKTVTRKATAAARAAKKRAARRKARNGRRKFSQRKHPRSKKTGQFIKKRKTTRRKR